MIKETKDNYILINRKDFIQRTKKGLLKAKEQGKHIGRPFKLSLLEIQKIIDLLDSGISCRKIAKKFNVSHTCIAKIRQEGLDRFKRMSIIQNKEEEEEQKEQEEQKQEILKFQTYAFKLKSLLSDNNISLSLKECRNIIKSILIDNKEIEITNYFEYKKPTSYVELTMHSLNVKN